MEQIFNLGLNLVTDMCNGTLKGAQLGSTSVTFNPGNIVGGKYSADCKTAGYFDIF